MRKRIRAIWRAANRPFDALWKWAKKPRDRAKRFKRWDALANWANRKRKQAPAKSEKRAQWAERMKAYRRKRKANRPRKQIGEPKVIYTRISPNRSSRGGVTPRLIVLHSTESDPNSLRAIVDYFAQPSAQASSHIVTDAAGNSARCVPDDEKAWTQASYNPQSLSIEQCGRASQTYWPDAQLDAAAQWIAYWSRKYGIPIEHSTSRGVCRHSDLGASGGGHHDPGAYYPFAEVLRRAKKLA